MRRFKYMFLLCACLATLAILATQNTGVEAATHRENPPLSSPLPTVSTSVTRTLFGVAGLSSTNIWAVGTSMNVPRFTSQPLIEHWNGQSWQIIPHPTTIPSGSLSSITASGPRDIWAVGNTYSLSGRTSEPLILHWNGTSWHRIPVASTSGNSGLLSITAVNAHDIWAVGSSSTAKASKTLILHWNGTAWQSVSGAASTMSFTALSDVVALSDHDIWAVGNSFSQPLKVHPFIEHWDGKNWSAVAPSGLASSFVPTAISALSADDIWVTGTGTLAHWNGKNWQQMTGADQKGLHLLTALTVLAHDNVWAVGFSVEAKSAVTHIEHWNGRTWQVLPGPHEFVTK